MYTIVALSAEQSNDGQIQSQPGPLTERASLRVLIVEDDAADVTLLSRALQKMPRYTCKIVHAESLTAARTALAVADFDAVLLDYSVHTETGTSLLLDLKSQTAPVILLSSDLTTAIESEALSLGAAACLPKDAVTSQILETLLRQALQRQTPTQVAAMELLGRYAGTSLDLQDVVIAAAHQWRGRNPNRSLRLVLSDMPASIRGDQARLRYIIDDALEVWAGSLAADRAMDVVVEVDHDTVALILRAAPSASDKNSDRVVLSLPATRRASKAHAGAVRSISKPNTAAIKYCVHRCGVVAGWPLSAEKLAGPRMVRDSPGPHYQRSP